MIHRIIRDAAGRCVDLEHLHQNAAAARINGFPAGAACAGLRLLTELPGMRGTALWASYQHVADAGGTWEDDVYFRDKHIDGWFHVTLTRVDDDTLVSFRSDITERRRAEAERNEHRERLESLVAEAPLAIAVFAGPELRYSVANATYRGLFPDRPLVGRPLREALPELVDEGIVGICERVFATGEPFQATEAPVSVAGADGTPEQRYFDFVVQPTRDAAGAIDGLLTFGTEVTHQVLARRATECANRAKDEFFAMLGHELRNPLSPILTALHLMRVRGGGDTTRERTIIERQVMHLVRLVDDLLDVSRIARGKLDLRRAPVEAAEIVARSVETASPLLEQRRHHLDVDIPPEGLTVLGDPTRLAQVVSNLLTNAAKYTDPGGHISVSASREDGFVALRVHDDGMGMSPEVLARVFDDFVQAPQSIDRARGGLGLGLAIVKNLVTMHGGTVSAHSDGPGRGSEFVVRVPAMTAPGPQPAEVAPAPAGRTAHGVVLVVDDNVDSAEMLAEVLAEMGYTAIVAHDGPEALRLAAQRTLDVALLDIGLPVMDGYELARRLRSTPGGDRVRLVAITGYGQESDVKAAHAAGFDAHLVKPVALEKLEGMLGRTTTATPAPT